MNRCWPRARSLFPGQALFCVLAETRIEARKAARLFKLESEELPALTTVDDAVEADSFLHDPMVFKRGDATAAIEGADDQRSGRFYIGGQEHFNIEGQGCLALPGLDGIHDISSTQHPSEFRTLPPLRWGSARLRSPSKSAAWAAPLWRQGNPGSPARRDRSAGGAALGRRSGSVSTGMTTSCSPASATTSVDYAVGFDHAGRVTGVEGTMASRCGYGHDLSRAINDRAMFHADNAYFYPSLELTSLRAKTDTVSNTAFRGFGGPQGMMLAERVMDRVAAAVLRDPLDVRPANLRGERARDHPLRHAGGGQHPAELMTQLAETADYRARRAAIIEANANAGRSPLRRGLALTPVRFGISFTTSFLNQAGALIHIYKDGSVQLNHGGTEMGQGLYIKVARSSRGARR